LVLLKVMAVEQDEKFLEFLIKSIVDNPDDVKIERRIDEMGVLLSLKVNPKDMGNVIGKQGQTAKAIRSLLRIVGIKNNARVNLKIEEPENSEHKEHPEADRGITDKVMDDIKGL
jgi:predicted RNA-binding protein YlqC (UPF0109 family)